MRRDGVAESRLSVWEVFLSVDIPDIFILTKLHEFVTCKGSQTCKESNWCNTYPYSFTWLLLTMCTRMCNWRFTFVHFYSCQIECCLMHLQQVRVHTMPARNLLKTQLPGVICDQNFRFSVNLHRYGAGNLYLYFGVFSLFSGFLLSKNLYNSSI